MEKEYEILYEKCKKENNLNLIDEFVKNMNSNELKSFCKANYIQYKSKKQVVNEIKKWFKIKYAIEKEV